MEKWRRKRQARDTRFRGYKEKYGEEKGRRKGVFAWLGVDESGVLFKS